MAFTKRLGSYPYFISTGWGKPVFDLSSTPGVSYYHKLAWYRRYTEPHSSQILYRQGLIFSKQLATRLGQVFSTTFPYYIAYSAWVNLLWVISGGLRITYKYIRDNA